MRTCIVVLVVGRSYQCFYTLLSQIINGLSKDMHCRSGNRKFLPMLLDLAVTENQQ